MSKKKEQAQEPAPAWTPPVFTPEQIRRHGHIINLWNLRLSQMSTYDAETDKAMHAAHEAWSKADEEAELLKKVPGATKIRLAGLLKEYRRCRQKRDAAHKHWLEVRAVSEQLATVGIHVEMPPDPTKPFEQKKEPSNMAKRIEAARKHMYAEAPPPKYDLNPPRREAAGTNYQKVNKLGGYKPETADIPVVTR